MRLSLAALSLALLLCSCAMTLPALAHDDAAWIGNGQYKNAIGELCCGETDCAELAKGDVVITPAGFFITSLNETVAFSEALPLPAAADEFSAEHDRVNIESGKPLRKRGSNYWRCQWGGKRKCFFAPVPSL